MSRPKKEALAVAAVFIVVTVANGVLEDLNGSKESFLDTLMILLVFVLFAAVGALIRARRPSNRLAWVFIGLGLGTMLGNLGQSYGEYAVITRDGALPLGVYAEWAGLWLWPASIALIFLIPLYFPDGRLPSRRWRPIAWLAAVGYAGTISTFAFKPGRLGDNHEFPAENPFGIPALQGVLDMLSGAFFLLPLAFVAGIVSLFVRARRADGQTRQQLKWFGYSSAATVVVLLAGGPIGGPLGNILFALGLACLPVGIGIAVMRYRLYDIDVIINRTLVYGALTAMLAVVYLGSILLLQRVLPLGRDSDVAVAASTLAVAALFRPARSRIQSVIDRRFYRSRYDAAATLTAFGTRLRDELHLDLLTSEVTGVVATTLRPSHVSLWIRAPRGEDAG